MHLKKKGYCYGVLLVYTITTITSHSPGRCEPTGYSSPTNLGEPSQPNSNGSDLRDGRKAWGILTANPLIHQSDRTTRRRNRHDLGQTEVAIKVPSLQSLLSRDPDLQSFNPTMVSSRDKRFQTRDKEEGTVTFSSFNPRSKDCSEGEINSVISGKFYMAGHLETSIPNVGYQSDSAVTADKAQGGQVRVRGQLVSGPGESWQRLQPVVKCGENAMTLTVRRRRAAQLLLDRVNTSSLPLSQLPSQCGYTVKTTWRDLTVTTPYDACHVTQEDDSYVLPLLWRGNPVKMSCPVSQVQPHTSGPSSLCCSPYGMTVTLPGQYITEELKVKVRGEWTPLELLVQQCGYTLDRQAGDLLITAPFITCGITVKDGKYTLSLQIGEKAVTLACPVSPPEDFPQTHQLVVDGPHHPASGPAEPVPETLQSFPWAPPFYLAPPYYPHPTYPHKYPSADTHHGYNPSIPLSLTPNPTAHPQPLPSESQPVYQYYYSYQMPPSESYKGFNGRSSPLSSADEMGDSYRAYPDLGRTSTSSFPENLSTTHSPSSATGFPVPVEAPSLQRPSHTFNPYYHYYHHPKIPLPDPPQDPGAEIVTYKRHPEEQPAPVSHDPDFLVLPHYMYQPKAPGNVNSDQFHQPVTEAASHPATLPVTSLKLPHRAPAPHAPYPQQPYPHYYFYHHPRISRGEAKRLDSPSHGTFTTTSLPVDPQTTEPGTSAQPLPNLPQLPIHYKYNFHPYIVQPSQNHPSDPEMLVLRKHLYKDQFGALFTTPPNELGKPQLDGSLEGLLHPLLSEVGNVRSELKDKKRHSVPVVPAAQPLLPPNYPHFYYPPRKSPQSSHQHGSNPITNPPPEQPSSTTLSPHHNPNLYPYYYHPYYHYYRMYYGPERLPNGDNHPQSPKEALDPQTSAPPMESPQRPAYLKHTNPIIDTTSDNNRPRTTTESMYDIQNGPLHPYYDYYRHNYQPRVAIDEQEPHPAGSMYSGKATSKSEIKVPPESTSYRTGSIVHPAGAGSPSMLEPHRKSSRSPSPHQISQQRPYYPFQHSDGEEAEERPADEMRDRPKANSFTPAASPCGLGPVSNHDCSSSLACCSYPVDECTMGHHFVFVVPDSVLQPTVAPPAQLSEVSNVFCTPQRLTSDPDLYTVPLDGCGVHRHMAGQTAVHLLEVQGIQPLQQDHNSMHEGFPVRLMVECRSSPGSPGKVKFQVMSPSPAPPVQSTPATVTVQLRIATDESFTSYHPEAHQPLSLMQGRPVYLEVGLLNPPEPGLVLLVHYCLVYTHTPYASWMLIYDGCPSHGDSQVLPLPPPPPPSHPHQTRRLTITSFLSLPTESPSHLVNRGYSHLEDPEVYFLCSTEVCSAADGDCTVGCISSPKSDA